MKKIHKHFLVSLWLALCLVFVQTVAGQMVLCVGSDGHVALEVASGDGQCGDDVHLIHEIACLDVGHCGPCQDVAISSDDVDLSKRQQNGGIVYRICESFESVVVSNPILLTDLPSSSSVLPAIQTVVLLI